MVKYPAGYLLAKFTNPYFIWLETPSIEANYTIYPTAEENRTERDTERVRERPVRNKLCSFRGLNPKLNMRRAREGRIDVICVLQSIGFHHTIFRGKPI